jgi:hypothetical protein
MGIATRISFVVIVLLFITGVRQQGWRVNQAAMPVIKAFPQGAHLSAPGAPHLPTAASRPDDTVDQGVTDLYGNDISDAVARYKLDAEGSLYELHSPRTELPRLGSPKS